MQDAIPFTKETFVKYMSDRIRGKEAVVRKNAEEFIKDYIVRKASMVNNKTRRKLSSGTIYNHNNALSRLQLYCQENHKRIVWELFDKRLAESLTAWMNDKGYSANTIASQYSIMKVWLSDAETEGFITDKSFHKYPTATHEVDNIYLTEEEILRIYQIDFSDEKIKKQIDPKSNIEQTRDLFIVACWTGLRFGDWHDFSRSLITEDRITLTTHKTLKEVAIPIHPMVRKIIKKYNGKLPKSLDKSKTIVQIQKCGELAQIDAPTVLHRIRGGEEVTIIEPKYKFITNHTARRTFCTNMYLRKIPTKVIMDISGHTTEANFFKYIKISPQQSAKQLESSFKDTEINVAEEPME
jgi:integrase